MIRRAREFDLIDVVKEELEKYAAEKVPKSVIEELMDTSPIISVKEWYSGSPPNCNDQFYLKVCPHLLTGPVFSSSLLFISLPHSLFERKSA